MRSQRAAGLSGGPFAAVSPTGASFDLYLGDQHAVVVELGAGLRSYTAGGRSIIDGYAPDEACTAGRGQLLAPWPNRIRDGRYSFRGRDLQLPLSEPERHNAIHGLSRWSCWTVADRVPERVVLSYGIYPQEGYPFTVSLTAAYALSEAGLRVEIAATNIGTEACPYGAGAHPYVAVGPRRADAALLRVPALTVLVADARAIPVGSMPVDGPASDFRVLRPAGSVHLDTCFTDLIRDPDGLARVLVQDASQGWTTEVWMDEAFPYLMIYTGDTLSNPAERRRGIAVEPMTCAPNAFNSGDGLKVLEPGESVRGSWGIDPFGAREKAPSPESASRQSAPVPRS